MKSMTRYFLAALFVSLMRLPARADQEQLRGLMAEASDFQAEYTKTVRTKGQIEAAKREIAGSELALLGAIDAIKGGDESGRPQSLCPPESANKAIAAACNTEISKLDGWKKNLAGDPDGLKKYREQLLREQERLTLAGQSWSAKKKSNEALLDVLDVAFQSWQRRYAALVFKSAPYSRLVSTEEGSARCKIPPDSGREAILEGAQGCLQWLWVGAMQNR